MNARRLSGYPRLRRVERLALALYDLAWHLCAPVIAVYLLWRSVKQPAYRQHWSERWAWRWDLPLRVSERQAMDCLAPIWIHAVSVGETRAAQPLIEALMARYPDRPLLLTHMTPTGRAVGQELYAGRWPQRVWQTYLPYDLSGAMDRFLARWRPCVGIIMETELWPGLCARAAAADLPLVLANARLSDRSLKKGLRWRALITPALASLDAVFAQTDADAARLRHLGCSAVSVLGNLKFDNSPTEALVALGQRWRAAAPARKRIMAASTREGEEALILQAWRLRHGSLGSAQLLIVPRHPQRFDAVAAAVTQAGFSLHRRSANWPEACASADVLLGDSMGEMAAYYAMADMAIIGGSLLPFGAQNLIEACAQGVPVLVGPYSYNFEQAAIEAIAAGAAHRVTDASHAVNLALSLLDDGLARGAMADAGRAFSVLHRGATQRTVVALSRWIQ